MAAMCNDTTVAAIGKVLQASRLGRRLALEPASTTGVKQRSALPAPSAGCATARNDEERSVIRDAGPG